MSKNENFKFALVYEMESDYPQRSSEERQQVLINKIHAQMKKAANTAAFCFSRNPSYSIL
ncbi:hypothetical protein [Vibrio owensii]|uniref:Uncharacterized protein n=1 Tax=Vibrio owensii CAIM 1854 = LMG 25443 TaxID=1229493 RepID=A0A0C1YQS8_9VIBR|nr:hypothetical protein [Vibrio owensii]KIF47510.1 hypothetical protein H735_27280 [Vibrio owensii CAIM 1854 = LMG 25443]